MTVFSPDRSCFRCFLCLTGLLVWYGLTSPARSETKVLETIDVPVTPIKIPVIGMVLCGLEQPAYQKLEEYARQYCRSSGQCRILSGGALGNTDDSSQRIWLKQLVAEKVDGLIIAPSGGSGLIGQLVQAKRKGIPIVNIGSRFDQERLGRQRLIMPGLARIMVQLHALWLSFLSNVCPQAPRLQLLPDRPGTRLLMNVCGLHAGG
ncbi:hypothetical protein M3P05_17110 [Sansalvadorimonas sp. 2012CJ34-2]|uniref:Periplasmic binding protein domain-containing protein n=1 Tax=Parendozoicomonas callyspongiae TaxID=2942213 RepID=A0ABT0PJS3_9GAMM|nr:hypothetical protein [Sansalvadorimonas sp. 2012CJ34-2]MCL6271639.1 hypothetical protein [Sansalvadorimonas sp. 2012CJ34-2]